jgi:hypothetical protein
VDPKKQGNFKIHLGLVFAEIICVSAFIIELFRAMSGNMLSWAYVFEWPIFAAYAIYMWHKLLNDGVSPLRTPRRPSEPANDDALAIYNDYLRSVHHHTSEDTSAP